MLVAVKLASRAQAAPASRNEASKNHPPLMQNWQVFGPLNTQGNAAKYAIRLVYPGKLPYPVIERNKDIVPAMRTQLLLHGRVKLLMGGSYKSQFSDRLWRRHWHRPIPTTNLRWRIVRGAPTWEVVKVGPSAPRVAFWVSGQPGVCFQAKTMGVYRRHRRWMRIPHSPVQTAKACLPSPPATTTATTTSTPTTTTPTPSPGWTNVVDDQFDSGGIPSHWSLYSDPYGSAPYNCTDPAHDFVSDGYLHLVESYESSKPAGVSCPYGAGWYTGGLTLPHTAPYSADNQRVTVRFRIVSAGGVVPHFIIPMRRADNSEEDFFESDALSDGHTFLHYAVGRIRSDPAYSVDVSQWHTVRFTQLNHVVSAYIDDMTTPVWVYDGDSTTTPDATLWRHVVLQQECSHTNGCPKGTSGSSDIQIDWITVDNAS
jgi:hypothetical protein